MQDQAESRGDVVERVAARCEADCPFRGAVLGPVAVACRHGYDACPACDPCTCEPTYRRPAAPEYPATPAARAEAAAKLDDVALTEAFLAAVRAYPATMAWTDALSAEAAARGPERMRAAREAVRELRKAKLQQREAA